MAEKKYYVVWSGFNPGVYLSWKECEAQIRGFPNAVYKAFASHEMAKDAFRGSASEYMGKEPIKPLPSKEELRLAGKPLIPSFSVDAACSGNPGDMEYRGVDTKTGMEFFRVGPYPQGTVNIGEFLAIVHGLAFLQNKKSDLPIYTDSKTAMKWIRDKKANTKLEKTRINAGIFDLIVRAEKWLHENSWPNQILKWKTQYWGEIPADFGRK